MKKINNIKDLRDDLVELYQSMDDADNVNIQTARTKSSIAGNIIRSVQVELAERVRTKNPESIPFLSDNNA
jgi:hypothetical protein